MSDPARRLAEFLKAKPRLLGLVAGLNAAANTLDGVLADLALTRVLSTATGVWLDALGAIVGQPREGRDDATYRLWIAARVKLNRSSGTVEQILGVFGPITSGYDLKLTPRAPAAFEFEILGEISASDAAAFARMLREARAAGVGGQLVWAESPESEWFRFDESQPPAAFTDDGNTVFHFALDEADGSAASTVGGYTLAEVGSTVGTTGQIGNQRDFDDGGYLAGSVAALGGLTDFTLMFWVTPDALPAGVGDVDRMIQFADFVGGPNHFNVRVEKTSGGTSQLNVTLGGTDTTPAGSVDFAVGTRMHIGLIRSGSSVSVVKNGVLVDTLSVGASAIPGSADTLILGSDFAPFFFDGKLDDVVLQNVAMTVPQVAAAYQAGLGLTTGFSGALDIGKWRGAAL